MTTRPGLAQLLYDFCISGIGLGAVIATVIVIIRILRKY
jgi:hypothetical protein